MGEAFITRRGGIGSEQALAPTITEVSTTQTSITFTITNNDASTAVILYELDDATPDANSIELAAAATSSNIVITGLAQGTAFDVYATANVTGKVKSNVTELEISTDPLPVYTAATGGTTAEYDDGGKRYKSHTFTSNGTFTVTTVGDATGDRNKVDYLIIAGGGGAGFNRPGGGGAGGYRTTLGTSGRNSSPESKIIVTATNYGVVVGAGGSEVATSSVQGSNGNNSSIAFTGTPTSLGGGGGGSNDVGFRQGLNGGSGGGNNSQLTGTAGLGTSNEGFDGGAGNGTQSTTTTPTWGSGGGGGAGGNGTSGSGNGIGGNGGAGLGNILRTGSEERRGGGGAGLGHITNGTVSDGGGLLSSGTANTGGGGSGNSGAGGSGIVIIRYEIAPSV